MGEAIRSLSEQEIKEIIYKELPKLVREHPEVRSFLQDVLKQCSYKEVSESRFEILLEEIKKMREESERRWEESERKWRELKEESDKKWQELKEESKRKWQESERKW